MLLCLTFTRMWFKLPQTKSWRTAIVPIAVPTDVTNREMVFHAADQAVQTFGEIDIWVNCAGYSKILPFLDCTQDIWDRTIAINLTGTFLGCQAAVTKMKGHGGSIINFSSQSGKERH